jgi:polysaccharide pyruvyl transferase WcaK-like protein
MHNVSESSCARHKPVRIGLLGAEFDTGNMGVSALAESSIKCILHRWPDAEVMLLGSGRVVDEEQLRIGDKNLRIKRLPIRFCRNIFLENHFVVLCFYAFLFKVFRWERFKSFCARQNAGIRGIIQMDIVADITGGDSFSDIYGIRRFMLGFLCKWLVLFLGKKLVLLPQTYGPFKRPLTQKMARYVLQHANLVYSRDRAGVEYLKNVLNINANSGKVRFAPDVAFILDSRRPDNFDSALLPKAKDGNTTLVGLNISGLLFNGGYTQDNMFGLRTDYRGVIHAITEMFLKDEKVVILLIPHVFPPACHEVENDFEASLKVYERLNQKHPGRIFLTRGQYSQGEIKYIIGMCDFFVGSRMHACIAALSQGIPAVGIAYSKKFHGVFESIGLSDCVADARTCTEDELLREVGLAFESRELIRRHLQSTIPSIQREVLDIFKVSEL